MANNTVAGVTKNMIKWDKDSLSQHVDALFNKQHVEDD